MSEFKEECLEEWAKIRRASSWILLAFVLGMLIQVKIDLYLTNARLREAEKQVVPPSNKTILFPKEHRV